MKHLSRNSRLYRSYGGRFGLLECRKPTGKVAFACQPSTVNDLLNQGTYGRPVHLAKGDPSFKAQVPTSCVALGVQRSVPLQFGGIRLNRKLIRRGPSIVMLTIGCVIHKQVVCVSELRTETQPSRRYCTAKKTSSFTYADTCLSRRPVCQESIQGDRAAAVRAVRTPQFGQCAPFDYTRCLGKKYGHDQMKTQWLSKTHYCVRSCERWSGHLWYKRAQRPWRSIKAASVSVKDLRIKRSTIALSRNRATGNYDYTWNPGRDAPPLQIVGRSKHAHTKTKNKPVCKAPANCEWDAVAKLALTYGGKGAEAELVHYAQRYGLCSSIIQST